MIRIDTGTCGALYFHQMTGEPGDLVPTHEHTYDHVMQVQTGTIRLWTSQEAFEDMTGPAMKMVPAGVAHDVEFVTAAVVCCIHEMRDETGKVYPFAYQRTNREVAAATGRM